MSAEGATPSPGILPGLFRPTIVARWLSSGVRAERDALSISACIGCVSATRMTSICNSRSRRPSAPPGSARAQPRTLGAHVLPQASPDMAYGGLVLQLVLIIDLDSHAFIRVAFAGLFLFIHAKPF